MAKTITLASAVGGCGKSTLAVSLAYALAARGKRVLLVDLSFPSPTLASLCSVSESVIYTVFDLADGTVDADTLLLPVLSKKGEAERACIALAPMLPSLCPRCDGIGEAVKALSSLPSADFVIVDASVDAYLHLAPVSDERVLLTDARESSLSASESMAFSASRDFPFTYFVLKSSLLGERIRKDEPLVDMIDRVSLPLLGILPHSDRMLDAGLLSQKKHAREPYARAVSNIAARLMGESVPLLRGITLEGISRRRFFERCDEI